MEPILSASDLRVSYGVRAILDGVTCALHRGERVGVVGRNGAGKSTLLKILARTEPPDSGELVLRRGCEIGFLAQEMTFDPDQTVGAAVREGAERVTRLLHEFEALDPQDPRASELLDAIERHDGWNLDSRLDTAMRALGAPPADRLLGSLSGGERRRTALCQVLVGQPDLLILDEPTNHLDLQAVRWLEEFLAAFPGTALFVTHDRHFMDTVCTRMMEVSFGRLFSHPGNYSDFLEAQAARIQSEDAQEQRRLSFLRRELDWVRRGPKARTTKAKSRLDRYDAAADQRAPDRDGDVDLLIPPPPRLPNRPIVVENASLERGGRTLFAQLTFTLEPGDRLGIVGPNGAGKSSLIEMLQGRLAPSAGTVAIAPTAQFNYIDQQRGQLDLNRTLYDEIGGGSDAVEFGGQRLTVRSYLRRFLFTEERIQTVIAKLSGGEKNRVLLAKQLLRGGNILVLDEPTNDLDLHTLRLLEEALATFEGCVLVVSHDRFFLDRVCTHILGFVAPGRVEVAPGDCSRFDALFASATATAASASASTPAQAAAPAPAVPPKRPSSARPRKLSFKEARELDTIESRIQDAEDQVAALEAKFADPDFYKLFGKDADALKQQLADAQAAVAALYQRWDELESLRVESLTASSAGPAAPLSSPAPPQAD